MKMIVLAAFMGLISVNAVASSPAFSPGGDQQYTVYTCDLSKPKPGVVFQVEVRAGGLSGLTHLVINRSYEGGVTSKKVYVKSEIINIDSLTSLVVYEGKRTRLSIDTGAGEGPKVSGLLELTDAYGRVESEWFHCQKSN